MFTVGQVMAAVKYLLDVKNKVIPQNNVVIKLVNRSEGGNQKLKDWEKSQDMVAK